MNRQTLCQNKLQDRVHEVQVARRLLIVHQPEAAQHQSKKILCYKARLSFHARS